MYIKGRGVKVDYNLAYKYAKEALDKNYNRAKWTMAVLYHYGYGVNKDGNKALKLYETLGYIICGEKEEFDILFYCHEKKL